MRTCAGCKPGTKCGGRPVQGPGGRSPPEAEAILDVYMHNFDLILNYFPPLQILGTCPPVPQGLRVCELAI